ncbi:MAG: prepilin-type N-terminal cleavage/methylation domain-containing protein [bacterium]
MAGTKAFTLVELVIAMAVASIGLAGLWGLLLAMGASQEQTSASVKAVLCAQEKLEELRFGIETGEAMAASGREILCEGAYRSMERAWTLRASSLHLDLAQIEVECAYLWKGESRVQGLAALVVGGGG